MGPAPAFGPAAMGFGHATEPAQPSLGFGPATGPAPAFVPAMAFGHSPAQPSPGFGPVTGPPLAFGNSPAQLPLGLNGQGKPPRPCHYVKAARPYCWFPYQSRCGNPVQQGGSFPVNIKPAPADNTKSGVDDMMEGVTGQSGQAQIIGES